MNFSYSNLAVPYIGHMQTDWIIILSLVVIFTAVAIKWGTARTCVMALTLPVSAFLYTLVHDGFLLSTLDAKLTSPILQSALFGIICIFVYIMTHRMYRSYTNEGEHLLLAFLAGIATTCITLVVWIHTPALASIWSFLPLINMIFGASYALWWMIVSLLLLGYIRS